MQVAGSLSIIIIGLMIMFVGLFMVDSVSSVFENGSLYVCSYSTSTNSTASQVNITNSSGTGDGSINRSFAVTTFSTHCTSTNHVTMIANMSNLLNQHAQVNISRGGTLLTTEDFATTENIVTLSNLVVTESSTVTFNYSTNTSNPINITDSMITSSSESYTDVGNIYSSTVTTTGTMFGLLGLVLIIAGLAMAIGYLRGMVGPAA